MTTISMGGGDDLNYVQRLRGRGGVIVCDPDMRVRHYVDPRRMTLEYLTTAVYHSSRETIRKEGVPPGVRFAGIPRWLLRRWAEVNVRRWVARCRGDRVGVLARLRQSRRTGGMIRECLVLWRTVEGRGGQVVETELEAVERAGLVTRPGIDAL